MYCSKCGGELENGSRFCSYCGAPVESTNPAAMKPPAGGSWPQNKKMAKTIPTTSGEGEKSLKGAASDVTGNGGWDAVPVSGFDTNPGWTVPPTGKGKKSAAKKSVSNKSKKGGLIAAIVIILVAAIGVGVFLFINTKNRNEEYEFQMQRGYRYLEEGRYHEAVLAFDAAIDISPKRGEAYAGLGDAYTGLGDFEEAKRSYDDALERDDKLADAYLGLASMYIEQGDMEAARDAMEEGAKVTGDERLEEWQHALDGAEGTGSLKGGVSAYVLGGGTEPVVEARVRLYLMDTEEPRLVRAATTGEDGSFEFTGLSTSEFRLTITEPGYMRIESVVSAENGQALYTESFVLIPEESGDEDESKNKGDGTDESGFMTPGASNSPEDGKTEGEESVSHFTASTTNVLDGNGIPNAEVWFREGWSNYDGPCVLEDPVYTDEYGYFSVDGLPYGYYTVELRAENFNVAHHNIAVLPEGYYNEWDLPVSPILSEGETRIVLTWGENPSDLDSHLFGEGFEVFFSSMNYGDSNGPRVNLDLDDTSSFGPETITIYAGMDRASTYYVHKYSGSGTLAASGATVRVFQGEGVVATYYVPTDLEGDYWTVFSIAPDGAITTINQGGYPY